MCLEKKIRMDLYYFSDSVKISWKTKKFTNKWRLNKMLLNNQWVEEEIKNEFKNT